MDQRIRFKSSYWLLKVKKKYGNEKNGNAGEV